MKINRITGLFFIAISIFFSCGHYAAVNYNTENLRVNNTAPADSMLIKTIEPYKNALSGEMDEVIGYCEEDMTRKKPESKLGNFVCDALLSESREIYGKPIDFAVYNYGGIRLDAIYAGNLTRSKIYELLPFENFGVIVTLDAKTTALLIQKLIDEGGWPVSGISFLAESGRASHIKINAQPFDTAATYHVVMNDYMANGGDHLDFLEGKEVYYLGATIRDIILAYIEKQNSSGKKITSTLDGRITYAE